MHQKTRKITKLPANQDITFKNLRENLELFGLGYVAEFFSKINQAKLFNLRKTIVLALNDI